VERSALRPLQKDYRAKARGGGAAEVRCCFDHLAGPRWTSDFTAHGSRAAVGGKSMSLCIAKRSTIGSNGKKGSAIAHRSAARAGLS
jgi:hypothetical protein